MIRRELSEKTKRILALADGTMTAAEIAAALGVTQNSVRGAVRNNRGYGGSHSLKPVYTGAAAYTRYDGGDFKCGGGMIEMFSGLAPDVQDWLVDQIPDGGTLVEVLRAIVVDAFAEEME